MTPGQLAERFFDAIERGDLDTVGSIYAEDAVIWHNYDAVETDRADNLATLAEFISRTSSRQYQDRRVSEFDGGFVQQHTLRLVGTGGSERRLHAAIVCRVVSDRIVRLDEYFDPAQLSASSR